MRGHDTSVTVSPPSAREQRDCDQRCNGERGNETDDALADPAARRNGARLRGGPAQDVCGAAMVAGVVTAAGAAAVRDDTGAPVSVRRAGGAPASGAEAVSAAGPESAAESAAPGAAGAGCDPRTGEAAVVDDAGGTAESG